MLAGHAGKRVRARHYTARDLEVMAKAVAKVELGVTAGAVAVGDDTIKEDELPNTVAARLTWDSHGGYGASMARFCDWNPDSG